MKVKYFTLPLLTGFILSSSCTYKTQKSYPPNSEVETVSEVTIKNSSLIDSLAKGPIVKYSDLDSSNENIPVFMLNGEKYTGRVFSDRSFDSESVAFEDLKDGHVVSFAVYYSNGQKAYVCDDALNYDADFFSPEGEIIDFATFANLYWKYWHEHEFEVPTTLICPACLKDIRNVNEMGDSYALDEEAQYRLKNKNKRGHIQIIQ